jgi:hypothetical protein
MSRPHLRSRFRSGANRCACATQTGTDRPMERRCGREVRHLLVDAVVDSAFGDDGRRVSATSLLTARRAGLVSDAATFAGPQCVGLVGAATPNSCSNGAQLVESVRLRPFELVWR